MTMFSTLLIANRGEIARRIMRTARAMGIRTVAVYTEADRLAPHVREADVAVPVESYLSVAGLVDAARATGADAVHPGYGFLSERAEFARAVSEAGLTFVGPSGDVIEQMGRKDAAREIAIAAGVPVVPQGDTSTLPVLVKAASGGGGKGMRIVRSAEELDAAIEAAKREALSAFGDDTLLIERYVEHGRHVEVQVLADHHGHVVHLFERDCSAQRRHQKVIEEAPAPGLSPAARSVLLDSAVALAREVGYTNAGTVEFLVAGDDVYFLEMNTRLQVEHPVTELITGLDLVELQLRIAAGEPLPFAQDDVRCAGHAFEARIYAEDAFGGFLPQAGTATEVWWPRDARVDEALESGQVVTTAYDPMLGKVIVHADDREDARRKLVAALDDTAIFGLTTNTGFLRALAASDAFRGNEIDTAWLDAHAASVPMPSRDVALAVAARAAVPVETGGWSGSATRQTPRDPSGSPSPFGVGDGWRLAGERAPVVVMLDGEWVAPSGDVPGARTRVTPSVVEVAYQGQTFRFERPDPFRRAAAASLSDGAVLAPMPGTVLAVKVAVGDRVEEGAPLGAMEAMKMELALTAPVAGTVTSVGAAAGDQVPLKHPLFLIEADSSHA